MQIPTEPTPKLVRVNNISQKTPEKTIRDFFAFCGKIQELELKKEGDHQTALILFERASAAKTAALLSNALLDESHIQVEPYFSNASAAAADEEKSPTEDDTKPKASVMAELLAAGYTLSDQVIQAGHDFDQKYGVRARVQPYWDRLMANLEKYNVTEKTRQLTDAAQSQANQWLQSSTGQKVQQQVQQHVLDPVAAIHAEAKRLTVCRKQR